MGHMCLMISTKMVRSLAMRMKLKSIKVENQQV